MLSEALETFRGIVDETREIKELPAFARNNPTEIFYRAADGTLQRHSVPPPARGHELKSLESLGAVVERFGSEYTTLWVSFERVVAILDDDERENLIEYRQNTARLPLVPSPLFATLAGANALTQKPFVAWLREHVEAVGELDPSTLRHTVSELRWSTTDDEEGAQTNDTARMGRTIASRVEGTDRLPEEVVVKFQPYPHLHHDLAQSVRVECLLVVDLERRTLALRPKAGQLDAAKVEAMDLVRAWVEGNVPERMVVVGSP